MAVNGDIALVGYFSDGTTAATDTFSFVILADLSGQTINFTDNGWLSSGSFRTGEGTVSYTVPVGTPIGTVVTLTGGGTFNLSTGGDSIIAYTGTLAAPTAILFGLDFANAAGWDATAADTNTSAVPPPLVAGTDALSFSTDNGAYTGPLSGTRAQILANIANPANWTTNDTAAVAYPGNFTVTSGAESQSVVFNPVSVTHDEGNSGATIYTFTVTRTGGTTGTLNFSGTIGTGTTDSADFTGGIAPTTFSGSIAAGQASATVTVSVNGDAVIEADESFQLTLTAVSNSDGAVTATIGANASATGNITNDDTPVLTIGNVTMSEGDAGTVTYTFTVSLDRPAPVGGVTFDIATADNSATIADGDYLGNSVTGATILEGSNSYTFDVTVNGDDAVEVDESFLVNVTNVVNATVSDGQAAGTITNDDNAGSLAIDNVALAEGNAGTTAFTFTVTRSGGDDGAVSATWTLSAPGGAGNADSGDFDGAQLSTGSVAFADGETSKTITVNVVGDTAFESDEAFTVTLSDPLGGVAIGDGSGAGTIQNDDAAPAGTFSIDDVSHNEGDSGATTYTFTVSRTGGTGGAVTVDYAIPTPGGAGFADAGDFVAGSTFADTLSFADGEASKTITIDVQGDTVFESDETFAVDLSNATGGATIGDPAGVGTIANDDAQPPAGSVAIADAAIVEGNSGTSLLVLTVTRTAGTAAFSVDYATANGGNPNNASATAGSDYVAQAGTVSFAEGEDVKTVSITINGDTAFELSEEFSVALSNATNGATIGDAAATATITNDDAAPTNVRLFEEDFTGFTAAGFAPNPTATQIDSDIWRVVGLSEIANPAYGFTAVSPPAGDFARGVITGAADPATAGVYSASGGAALILQPTGAELDLGGFLEARIQNTTGSTATALAVAFDWVYRNSGGRADNLQFSYSTDGTNFVTVSSADFSTPAAAEATTPSSFSTSNEVLNLTSLSIPDQSFVYFRWTHLNSAGSGNRDEFGIDNFTVDATVSGPPALSVSVSDVSVNEAAGMMTFTVTRNGLVSGAFTVDYATANGTAVAGQDYGATSGTLSFAENQVQATVTVSITEDAVPEFDDTVLLNLSNPTGGAVIADGQGVGTIVNDDGAPISVSIGDVTVTEGQSGTTVATFTVTRTGGTGAFSIDYATANQTAQAPDDYLAASGTLNFAASDMSETFTVTINGDTLTEDAETFLAQLSNPTNNALIADAVGVGTIATDDPTYIHSIQGTSYYSPILAAEGKTGFNVASTTIVIIRAVVTAVDADGTRQGFYVTEEFADWDSNPFTSEGIFVMTRNDANAGTTVTAAAPNIQVGDIVTFSAQVMEYQSFSSMPRTTLVNMTGFSINSSGNALPVLVLDAGRPIPNSILTGVTPDYTDSADGAGDSFDASLYALSYFETVEGMLVTIPDMVVADGFVQTVGAANDPVFQAYSRAHADADQINSRGGYTVAGDPPLSPPDTADTDDGTIHGGRHVHDGDTNPDIIELDFTDFAMTYPAGQLDMMSMGDGLGDVTGIIDFDFTDRKLFVTSINPGAYQDTVPAQETTTFGNDSRALTVATFNVENLDPTDGAARFAALAGVIANNLNSPDIVIIEEMQDNNGAAAGTTDASTSWQMLVDALNAAVPGAAYQWVDQEPVNGAEGGEPGGNIRVGFLYDTNRVQLGDLAPDATIAERREFTDRIGDGVRDAGDRILFSDDMIAGEINAADWSGTRKSLLAQFTFHGQTVFVAANHLPAKSGSGSYWQLNQNLEAGQPANSDFAQRNAVANDIYTMLNHIQANAAGAGVVSGGDYNDFYFYRPLEVATGYVLPDGTARAGGARFDNLTVTELTEAERYSYTFDGRSQTLDHIIVNGMLSAVAGYDVVHVNTGYSSFGTGANANPALSDHDPAVSTFDFRSLSETLVGTPQADFFDLSQGGDDTVSGLDGNDVFLFGATMTSADQVDGGNGTDQVALQGDYSAGLTFGANVLNIENLGILPGNDTRFGDPGTNFYSYNLTLLDVNVAAGVQMVIDANRLRVGENFTFNGSAENNGSFFIYGGGGTDNLTGGLLNDVFLFGAQGQWGATDVVNGGPGGTDQLSLRGDYTIVFGAGQMIGIENIGMVSAFDTRFGALGSDYDYDLTMNDGNVDSGVQMTVDAATLRIGETLAFNGSQESNGSFRVFGGDDADTIVGSQNADILVGRGSVDNLTGGTGNDVFRYNAVTDSLPTGKDVITDFTSGDQIDLSRIDANTQLDGDQAFDFIEDDAFGNHAGELRFEFVSGQTWLIQGDTDGNGSADFEITVIIPDLDPITVGDFIP